MQMMVEVLAQSLEKAGVSDAAAVAKAMEHATVKLAGFQGSMRAADHQFQQTLQVAVMERQGTPGVKFDVEGSGYGFRIIKTISGRRAEQPTSCRMTRP